MAQSRALIPQFVRLSLLAHPRLCPRPQVLLQWRPCLPVGALSRPQESLSHSWSPRLDTTAHCDSGRTCRSRPTAGYCRPFGCGLEDLLSEGRNGVTLSGPPLRDRDVLAREDCSDPCLGTRFPPEDSWRLSKSHLKPPSGASLNQAPSDGLPLSRFAMCETHYVERAI